MPARLEHMNYTVSDPAKTAAWMIALFDWKIRWKGQSLDQGYSVHVGSKDQYLALYTRQNLTTPAQTSYETKGGLNHIALVVDDIVEMLKRVENAGLKAGEHFDYEPGQRFYFYDDDNIEYEIVQYDS